MRTPETAAVGQQPVLQLDGITHEIGGVKAVDDLSFSVADGEFVTLLGPSGCGKSTTLRIIAGYASARSGDVFIRGESVLGLPPQRRNIGMVFQNYALFPHLSVARNIAFALSVRRWSAGDLERRVQTMLKLVQLEGFGDRLPAQLSGGQQQRVALARVLAFNPALLLLDEPLSALDLKLREDMQGEIKRIQREMRIPTIYVTHDQGEALNLSDRVAVMRNGRIEQFGTPDTVYRRPATRFVASFLGRMQFLDGHVLGFADNRQIVQLHGHDVRLSCVTSHPRAPGQPCTVGVRPEKVVLTDPDAQTSRRWSLAGHVEERQYLGTHAQIVVSTAHGPPLIAFDHFDAFRPGRKVLVSWDESDMSLFPEEGVATSKTADAFSTMDETTAAKRANHS